MALPQGGGMMAHGTQRAGVDQHVDPLQKLLANQDPSPFNLDPNSTKEFFSQPLGARNSTRAAQSVPIKKRKNRVKNTQSTRAPTDPKQVELCTLRQTGKKSIFQFFYQGVKEGGCFRKKITTGSDCLSRENIQLLDKELALYVCLNSKIIMTYSNRKKFKGPDGKAQKIWLKQICHPRVSESIMTKCCYEVTDPSIENFFGNAGLAAAWEKVSDDMRDEKPELTEVFDHIESIRLRVLPP